MKAVLKYLKQKTTWAGIITFATTVFGVNFAPELAVEIATAGASLASIVLIIFNEDK